MTTVQTTIEIKKQGTISETPGGGDWTMGMTIHTEVECWHEIFVSGRHTALRQQNSALHQRDKLVANSTSNWLQAVRNCL